MKKLLTIALLLLISTVFTSAVPALFEAGSAQSSSFAISGYILDSNGKGIAGANIIFNVPTIVPSVYSDSSGHYVIYAPAATYHVNVWPPVDSNYVNFDQQGLVVSSDMSKNITLQTGFKVSGYIVTASGAPALGAVVALNSYCSGYFSTSLGYYFISVPAGTYTLNVHPRTGTYSTPTTNFSAYNEYNFQVNSNIVKNITVGGATPSPSPTPDPNRFKISGYVLDSSGHGIANANVIFNVPDIVPSVWTNSAGYYEILAPAGTYHVNVWPPFDSNYINYDEAGFVVTTNVAKNLTLNSGCKVSGFITDQSGALVVGATVLFGNFGSGWFSNSSGYYFTCVPVGTYTINAHPRSGYNYSGPTTNFQTYYEYNFAVSGNTAKNITVSTISPTPVSTPNLAQTGTGTTTTNPTQKPTQAAPTPTQPPTLISTSTDETQETAIDAPSTASAPDNTVWIALAIGVILAVAAFAFVGKKRMPHKV